MLRPSLIVALLVTATAPDARAAILVDDFPYYDVGDTSRSTRDRFDAYACGTQAETGPEDLYAFTVGEPGTLVARVVADDGVDVDVHLLADTSAASCLSRGDEGVSQNLAPGAYFLSVDTFARPDGSERPGAYELHVRFIPRWSVCAMEGVPIARIGATELLPMPATGRVVKEAHLVTAEEHRAGVFGGGWPTRLDDRVAQHWALSEQASGFVAERTEPWAPCCEPSNAFGQGSTAKPPAAAEAWYLNMRWKRAPRRGQRYIVYDAVTGGAVVAAAGYENGPGNLQRIGGVAEEVMMALGRDHLSTLTFGVAHAGDALPYGPIDCAAVQP